MPNGAFALYVDLQAGSGGGGGGGGNASIDRVIPLPRLGDGHLEFDDRRLTLSYYKHQATALAALTVTVHFFGGGTTNVNVNTDNCLTVDVPRSACAVALHVEPAPAGSVRGPLSALVEYRDS